MLIWTTQRRFLGLGRISGRIPGNFIFFIQQQKITFNKQTKALIRKLLLIAIKIDGRTDGHTSAGYPVNAGYPVGHQISGINKQPDIQYLA